MEDEKWQQQSSSWQWLHTASLFVGVFGCQLETHSSLWGVQGQFATSFFFFIFVAHTHTPLKYKFFLLSCSFFYFFSLGITSGVVTKKRKVAICNNLYALPHSILFCLSSFAAVARSSFCFLNRSCKQTFCRKVAWFFFFFFVSSSFWEKKRSFVFRNQKENCLKKMVFVCV